MKYITAHWRGQLSLPMSYWVNGCVLTCLFVMFYVVVHDLVVPNPRDRIGMPLAILAIMFLNCPVLLTWQTMGLFRCVRRRGGFWPTVAVLTCVAMWLQWAKVWGENLSPAAVFVPLVFLIAIFVIAFRRRSHPSNAASALSRGIFLETWVHRSRASTVRSRRFPTDRPQVTHPSRSRDWPAN